MPLVVRYESTLLVVFGEDTLARMRVQDPFEIDLLQVKHSITRVAHVIASEPEIAHIVKLVRAGKPEEAIRFACRGWSWKPELGDGSPLISLLDQNRGVG